MRFWSCLFTLACASSAAGANYLGAGLHVVVDQLPKEAGACGIDGPSIESAAVRALQSSGVRVAAGLAGPYSYLYISARVESEPGAGAAPARCVVNTRVELVEVSPTQAPVGGFKGLKPRRNTTETTLCSNAGSSSGSPDRLGARLAGELERSIARCVGGVS
jgi:hypothetical protein